MACPRKMCLIPVTNLKQKTALVNQTLYIVFTVTILAVILQITYNGSVWSHYRIRDDAKRYHIPEVMALHFQRIRDLREDNDYTQEYLANYLSMHRSVYRRYESGTREIPVWALIKLSELYKVSTDYILGLTDKSSPDA